LELFEKLSEVLKKLEVLYDMLKEILSVEKDDEGVLMSICNKYGNKVTIRSIKEICPHTLKICLDFILRH